MRNKNKNKQAGMYQTKMFLHWKENQGQHEKEEGSITGRIFFFL